MDKKLKSSVIINEREAEPLSDYVIDFLTSSGSPLRIEIL